MYNDDALNVHVSCDNKMNYKMKHYFCNQESNCSISYPFYHTNFFLTPSITNRYTTINAGVVQCWAAILMGLISGSLPWYTLMVLHNKITLLRHVDDTFAIFHTHAIAGTLGGVLTGLFAVPKLSRLFYNVPDWNKYIGLAYALQTGRTSAGLRQMGVQLIGILFIVCLNIVATTLICLCIKMFVPLRVSEEELKVGDDEVHGEVAYVLSSDHRFENPKVNSMYDVDEYPSVVSKTSNYELYRV